MSGNTKTPAWLLPEISFQDGAGAKASQTLRVLDVVAYIQSGDWTLRTPDGQVKSVVSVQKQMRQTIADCYAKGMDADQIKKVIDPIKKRFPACTFSSLFPNGRNASLVENHSGLIVQDIDLKPVTADEIDDTLERQENLRELLCKSPHVAALFTSPSGYGLKPVFKIIGSETWYPDASTFKQKAEGLSLFHLLAWKTVKKWMEFNYSSLIRQGEIDEACKDVSRLCFMPYDPDVFIAQEPQAFDLSWTVEREAEAKATEHKSQDDRKLPDRDRATCEQGDRDRRWLPSALSALKNARCHENFESWRSVVFALATEYDGREEGLAIAQEWSSGTSNYDEEAVEKAYQGANGSVTAGTIWQLAKDAGWEPPKRKGPPTRGATQPEEADLNDILDAIDTSKPCGEVSDEIAGKSIVDLADVTVSDEEVLLGNRFLCRGGGMLYVGPSGVGKSSSSMQQDICWAVGREAFCIQPARPLKILTIQAENDEGDLKEMAEGVLNGLALTPDEIKLLRENSRVVSCNWAVSDKFIVNVLVPALNNFRPDIVRIDPFNAYLGGAPKDTEKVIQFLRSWINPVAGKFKVAVIINHHTPKTNYRDTSNYKPGDWMYAGAGDSDMTNWARAILVIDHTKDSQVYRFIAAKRGTRLGWVDDAGSRTIEKYFIHANKRACQASRKDTNRVASGQSEVADGLYWLEATPEEILASKKTPAKNTSDMDKILRLLEYLSGKNLSDKDRKRSQIEAWLMTSVKVAKTKAKGIVTAALEFEFIENLVPDSKKVKNSKYVVTEEGLAKLQEFTGNDERGGGGSDFIAKMKEAV